MKLIKDKKIIALIVILVVFTISYFIIINKVSYAFSTNNDALATYDVIVDTIKKCAISYAEKNNDIFKDDNIVYIKVQDLIDKGILLADNSGEITNPLRKNETLNNKIIKIKLDDDKIDVTIDS